MSFVLYILMYKGFKGVFQFSFYPSPGFNHEDIRTSKYNQSYWGDWWPRLRSILYRYLDDTFSASFYVLAIFECTFYKDLWIIVSLHNLVCRVVLEYVEGKSICNASGTCGGLGEDTSRRYLRDMVSGLMYLHAHVSFLLLFYFL